MKGVDLTFTKLGALGSSESVSEEPPLVLTSRSAVGGVFSFRSDCSGVPLFSLGARPREGGPPGGVGTTRSVLVQWSPGGERGRVTGQRVPCRSVQEFLCLPLVPWERWSLGEGGGLVYPSSVTNRLVRHTGTPVDGVEFPVVEVDGDQTTPHSETPTPTGGTNSIFVVTQTSLKYGSSRLPPSSTGPSVDNSN